MAQSCIFCLIANREQSADVIEERQDLLIFKDIKPKAPVHLLIVPKKHVASIIDLGPEDHGLVSNMIYAAKDIARESGLGGYRLCFNVGRQGGQIVDHLHLHLLGGWKEAQVD